MNAQPKVALRAALYARVSIDKSDKTSCDQQLRSCRELAESLGYVVTATYRDDFITGSDDNRPAFNAMLAASEAGEFDVLIADEDSRISRNSWVLPKLFAELRFRDQFLLTADGKLDSRDENAELLAGMFGGMSSGEKTKMIHRIKRGQRQRFDEGVNTGGRAFGYRSVRLFPGNDENRRAKFEIVEETAAIVDRIFSEFAAGKSTLTIAGDLNRAGIASPGADWNRKDRRSDGKWLKSAVRAILDNPLYVGQVVFNRYEWRRVPGTKRRSRRLRPEKDWMTREAPELRIVSDEVWAATRARRRAQRETARPMDYEREVKTTTGTRRAIVHGVGRGGKRRYGLSGILKCALCGSSLVMANATRYRCSSRQNGQEAACAAAFYYDRLWSEAIITDVIRDRLVTPARIELFAQEMRRAVAEAQTARPDGGPDRAARLAQLDRQIENYVKAIADGMVSPALRSGLAAAEAERERLLATRAPAPKIVRAVTDAAGRYRAIVDDLPGTMVDEPELAQQTLARLFGVIPVDADGNATITLEAVRLVSLVGFFPLESREDIGGSGGTLWLRPTGCSRARRASRTASPARCSIVRDYWPYSADRQRC